METLRLLCSFSIGSSSPSGKEFVNINVFDFEYVLNSSLNNTVFVVPQNTSVALNVSNGFYNPVTGQSNYQQSNFTWKLNWLVALGADDVNCVKFQR